MRCKHDHQCRCHIRVPQGMQSAEASLLDLFGFAALIFMIITIAMRING